LVAEGVTKASVGAAMVAEGRIQAVARQSVVMAGTLDGSADQLWGELHLLSRAPNFSEDRLGYQILV